MINRQSFANAYRRMIHIRDSFISQCAPARFIALHSCAFRQKVEGHWPTITFLFYPHLDRSHVCVSVCLCALNSPDEVTVKEHGEQPLAKRALDGRANCARQKRDI